MPRVYPGGLSQKSLNRRSRVGGAMPHEAPWRLTPARARSRLAEPHLVRDRKSDARKTGIVSRRGLTFPAIPGWWPSIW